MRRKGVALTLETIVVLVLAVLVLGVLLYFFSSNFYPAEKKIDDLNKQRDECLKYINSDTSCERPGTTELGRLCTRLGYQKCTGGPSADCMRQCCSLFCPAAPPQQSSSGSGTSGTETSEGTKVPDGTLLK